mmetsp:Transcript_21536/g.41309  ORF Transcript_21536/g.41309 Transcript_21536/m.41309 type:complete len:91 (-) Transcript_21536:1181-1453(-)
MPAESGGASDAHPDADADRASELLISSVTFDLEEFLDMWLPPELEGSFDLEPRTCRSIEEFHDPHLSKDIPPVTSAWNVSRDKFAVAGDP